MKRILFFALIVTGLFGCKEDYELNVDFSAPTTLFSPGHVSIDLAAGANVEFAWSGGGAEDSSVVIYQVLFDSEEGDFSNPIDTVLSDLGAKSELTMSHAKLNGLAREAGIYPESTGTLRWTVVASKGGVIREAEVVEEISVTRGEGIDNFPEKLLLYGDVTENDGQEALSFRKSEEGVFVIYSKIPQTGEVYFKSGTSDDAFAYYGSDDGRLSEGTGMFGIEGNDNPYRITVDFNSLSVTTETISNVRAIWGATFEVIGNLDYIGNGEFRTENAEIVFITPDRPETNPPSWLNWIEERYYFIAEIDGNEMCWGRKEDVSPERPTGDEPLSFYEINEFEWEQWEHLWKMSEDLDYTTCTITINTNIQGIKAHQFSDVEPL